jgi:ABC-type methionine transport system ATPase subunit
LAQKTERTISRLSGGQEQRVAIARAVSDPTLLLADDRPAISTATGHEILN